MRKEREIVFYGNHFLEFYAEQNLKVQEKIDFVLKLVKTVDKIPAKFFRHIEGTDGLFEIRVEYHSNIYRLFCCMDGNRIVVLLNAFEKKTQKTPRWEIEKAERLKAAYFFMKGERR